MNTIKRNKRILNDFKSHLIRLHVQVPITEVFNLYIFPNISVSDSKEIHKEVVDGVKEGILNNDTVLIEAVKMIGLMEICETAEELYLTLHKRKKMKEGDVEITDFDKILQGIMKVPGK